MGHEARVFCSNTLFDIPGGWGWLPLTRAPTQGRASKATSLTRWAAEYGAQSDVTLEVWKLQIQFASRSSSLALLPWGDPPAGMHDAHPACGRKGLIICPISWLPFRPLQPSPLWRQTSCTQTHLKFATPCAPCKQFLWIRGILCFCQPQPLSLFCFWHQWSAMAIFSVDSLQVKGGGTPGYVAYGATKRGLPQMTDSLVKELEAGWACFRPLRTRRCQLCLPVLLLSTVVFFCCQLVPGKKHNQVQCGPLFFPRPWRLDHTVTQIPLNQAPEDVPML